MDKQVFKAQTILIWLPLIIITPFFFLICQSIDFSVGFISFLLTVVIYCIPLIQLICHIEIDNENIYKTHILTNKVVQTIPLNSILNIGIKKVGQAEQLYIITIDKKQSLFGLNIYPEKEQLIKTLQSLKNFDNVAASLNYPTGDDIGQRPIHIIAAVLILLGLGIAFEKFFINAWHGSSENMFSWFFISFPVALILSYLWINGEKKSSPFAASLLTGMLLGGVFAYDFLLLNRWYNEITVTPVSYEFTFDEQNTNYQQWTPVGDAKNEIIFHDGYVRVHDVWDGYTNNFQVGKTYKIAVAKGNLNDIFFNKDAFTKAILVEK